MIPKDYGFVPGVNCSDFKLAFSLSPLGQIIASSVASDRRR
jgi:hypothetical protein